MKKCTIDPHHSVAAFAIRHLMIANVRGIFPRVGGVVLYDDQDITRSSVEATIDVSSLTTGVKKRDDHVLSGGMLDAARFPTMTFRSTSVERTGAGTLKVRGDLTIHGVTKRAAFDVEHFGPVKSPWGGEVSIGLTCRGTIDREEALVIPELKGKMDGMAIRVPTPNVSVVDLVVLLKKEITAEQVNKVLRSYAEGTLKGILSFCEEPLVSIDFNGNPHSSIVDGLSTKVIGGKLAKIISWYDNECGFSRMAELFLYLFGKK